MIIDTKNTSIAYRCPHCGAGVVSVVGVFALSGDMIKLKCSCGQSELTITSAGDGKLKLSVPCIICPTPHVFTVSKNALFSGDIFSLGCTYTGLDLCFVGEHQKVLDALKDSEEALNGLLLDAGVDDLGMLRGGDPGAVFDDPTIDEIIRFMLAELAEEGSLHCGCREGDTAAYGYEFAPPDYESVRVFCRTCGYEKLIPMTSTINANAFLHTDELFLEPPHGEEDHGHE